MPKKSQAQRTAGGLGPTAGQIAAMIKSKSQSAKAVLSVLKFNDRGLSQKTIIALTNHGIDAPERLLFASEADIRKIPGIGKASLAEIMRYRERFLPADEVMR